MSNNFSITVEEKARSKGLSAIQILSLADVEISAFDKAVIFYHGEWSGPSLVTLDLLCESLSEMHGIPELIVVNADELNSASETLRSKAKELFGHDLGAYGETCWISNGEIKDKAVLYWKEYEQDNNHKASGSSIRRREAIESEIKQLIADKTKEL